MLIQEAILSRMGDASNSVRWEEENGTLTAS